MTARRSWLIFSGLSSVVALSVVLLWSASVAAAERSIIKHPGDHPNYSVEIEPHLLAAFISPLAGSDGLGLGARFSIPIVENGFVPTINNNAAIGFGLDWIHYTGCWGGWGWNYYCPDVNTFYLPVVLQWNFFLSTHFSVYAELGFGLYYTTWPSGPECYQINNQGTRYCGPHGEGGHIDWNPIILMLGGRYHFSETVSLTARLGYPYFSLGVSFFP